MVVKQNKTKDKFESEMTNSELVDFAYDTLKEALEKIEGKGIDIWVRTKGCPPVCIRVGSDKMDSENHWFGYNIDGEDYIHIND